MINKDPRKSLARKKGNEILIWRCNNPIAYYHFIFKMILTPGMT